MTLFHWFQHYPLDALPYEVGFLLLAFSMIWYSFVLKKLVTIIRERPVWILPLLGSLFILVSVAMHSFAYVVLLPQMDALKSVDEIEHMSTFILQWRAYSLAGILVGGIFSLLGGGLYYRWTTR
jgi:hypothetical protein